MISTRSRSVKRPAHTGFGGRITNCVSGGAALTTSLAAYSRVCLPFGVLAFRVTWIAAFFLSLAASSPATTQKNLLAGPSASADSASLSRASSSDSPKADSVAVPEPVPSQQATPQAAQQPPNGQTQAVVERIEFLGNRRIR